MRRIYCYGSLGDLCESAAGRRRMLRGGAPAERLLSLNLSEWVILFRVGVAHETSPWTESDIRFAAKCWATGVIVSNEERFGNPYGPPELLARRPESERAAICQALAVCVPVWPEGTFESPFGQRLRGEVGLSSLVLLGTFAFSVVDSLR